MMPRIFSGLFGLLISGIGASFPGQGQAALHGNVENTGPRPTAVPGSGQQASGQPYCGDFSAHPDMAGFSSQPQEYSVYPAAPFPAYSAPVVSNPPYYCCPVIPYLTTPPYHIPIYPTAPLQSCSIIPAAEYIYSKILALDEDNARTLAQLEDMIIETMVERVKSKDRAYEGLYNDGTSVVFFSKDFTYTDSAALVEELRRWDCYDKKILGWLGLTFPELDVLWRRIRKNGSDLGHLMGLLELLRGECSVETCSSFDFIYMLCVGDLHCQNTEDILARFTPGFLTGLTGSQFTCLLKMLIPQIYTSQAEVAGSCLKLLLKSLDLNTSFILSSADASEIIQTLLCRPRWLSYRLLHYSVRLRASLTMQGALRLAESMSVIATNKEKDFFLKTYFSFTAKFTVSNTEPSDLAKLHSKFTESYAKAYGSSRDQSRLAVGPDGITADFIRDRVLPVMSYTELWEEHAVELPGIFSLMGEDTFKNVLLGENQDAYLASNWLRYYIESVGYPCIVDIVNYSFASNRGTWVQCSPMLYMQIHRINSIALHPYYNFEAFKRLLKFALNGSSFAIQIYLLESAGEKMVSRVSEEEWADICRDVKHPGCMFLPHVGCFLHELILPSQSWTIAEAMERIQEEAAFRVHSALIVNEFYMQYLLTCRSAKLREGYLEYICGIGRMRSILSWRGMFRDLLDSDFYGPCLRANMTEVMKALRKREEAGAHGLVEAFINVLGEQEEGKAGYGRLCRMVGPI